MEVTQLPTGGPPTREFADDWLARYADAWVSLRDRHDVEPLVAMYTPDVRYVDPGAPGPIHGHAELRSFLHELYVAFPDMTIDPLEPCYLSQSEPRALVRFRMSFKMTGPFPSRGLAPTNRRLAIEGVTEWIFRDGLACFYGTRFDGWNVAQQLGFVPAPDTLGYRLFTAAQRAQAFLQRRLG